MDDDLGNALPVGTEVGKYRIDGTLGSGGFGVTYLAWDLALERKVALKECLPVDLAHRRGDFTVSANSKGLKEDYQWALERFVDEARTLAKFRHRNVISVHDVFEANGTAYMVTGYEEGQDLESWLKRNGSSLNEERLRSILDPILDGLESVHAGGVLHRDIKPENIYITSRGSPILLDFGSARQSVSNRSRPMTAVVTPGYAPFEQYHEDGDQGPWTDLYALSAVVCRALTGKPPPEATKRERRDPYQPLGERLKGKYSDSLLSAIDAGLKPEERQRPQDVATFRKMLGGETAADARNQKASSRASASPSPPKPSPASDASADRRPPASGRRPPSYALLILLALSLGGAGFFFGYWQPEQERKAAARGGIVVRTKPPGAEVRIGGATIEESPVRLFEVKLGTYPVTILKEGYREKRLVLTVEENSFADPGLIELELIAGSAFVTSRPSNAEVWQGDRQLGQTPLRLTELAPGRVSYELRKEGYKPASLSGLVKEDEELNLPANLEREAVWRKLGKAYKIPGLDSEMVWIDSGRFMMGSPAGEAGRRSNEPQRSVSLSKGYWLGKYEVTISDWQLIMKTTLGDQVRKALYDDALYTHGSEKKTLRETWDMEKDSDVSGHTSSDGDNYPMTHVNWADAVEFCRRLTVRERSAGRLPMGYEYRLPTEAQWEFACRSGNQGMSYLGDFEILGERNAPRLDDMAWYGGNSGLGYKGTGWDTTSWKEMQFPGEGRANTRLVGLKRANDYGLYDMLGNVWEWCSDYYEAYPNKPATDPTGPESGSNRVFRGGSWFSRADECRSAYRGFRMPGFRDAHLGFRLCLRAVD